MKDSYLKQVALSITSALSGLSLNDVAQFIAIVIAIVSGLLAIRNYIIMHKINKLKLEELENEANNE